MKRTTYYVLPAGLVILSSIFIATKTDIRKLVRMPKTQDESWYCPSLQRYFKGQKANRRNRLKRVVFHQNLGGLGDNIRGLIEQAWMAYKSNRFIFFDIQNPYPLSSVLSENAVDLFAFTKNDAWDKVSSQERYRNHGALRKAMKSSNMTIHSTKKAPRAPWMEHNKFEIDFSNVTKYINESESCKNTDFTKRIIARKLLEPSKHILKMKNEFLALHNLCAYKEECVFFKPRNYYAIHARLGGGTGEYRMERFAKMYENIDFMVSCFVKSILSISERENDRNPVIFVATDTQEFKKKFKLAFEKRSISGKVISQNSSVSHYLKINSNSTEGKEIFLAQHVELRIIGGAKQILATWSGYSKSAFLLGTASKYTMISHESCEEEEIR